MRLREPFWLWVRTGKAPVLPTPDIAGVAKGVAVVAALVAVYYALPFGVAIGSLGEVCPYSPAGLALCSTDTSTPDLCDKPGIRFVGRTKRAEADEAVVCFTLTPNRRAWVEIAYEIDCVAGTIFSTQYKGPTPFNAPGQIALSGFTARIRGARAGGKIENSVCPGKKTFRWSAQRRAPAQ